MTHKDVHDAGVVGVSGDRDIPFAFVVLKPNTREAMHAAIKASINEVIIIIFPQKAVLLTYIGNYSICLRKSQISG